MTLCIVTQILKIWINLMRQWVIENNMKNKILTEKLICSKALSVILQINKHSRTEHRTTNIKTYPKLGVPQGSILGLHKTNIIYFFHFLYSHWDLTSLNTKSAFKLAYLGSPLAANLDSPRVISAPMVNP